MARVDYTDRHIALAAMVADPLRYAARTDPYSLEGCHFTTYLLERASVWDEHDEYLK